jgi:hypothetical protein
MPPRNIGPFSMDAVFSDIGALRMRQPPPWRLVVSLP